MVFLDASRRMLQPRFLKALGNWSTGGYDSAGLAALFPEHTGPIETERTTGYVSDLATKANGRFKGAHISMGHTRWATHGGVTDSNAHPHSNEDGTITIVSQQESLKNAPELLERIVNLGYLVESETDSEVIVHLIDRELKTQPSNKSPLDAFQSIISKLQGSWAIAAIISGMDGILVARNGGPFDSWKGDIMVFASLPMFSQFYAYMLRSLLPIRWGRIPTI